VVLFSSMARYVHVVRTDHRSRDRRGVEAAIARNLELVACAIAGLARPMLHGGLPALRGRTGAGTSLDRRQFPEVDVA
jgi:hypothetical protein